MKPIKTYNELSGREIENMKLLVMQSNWDKIIVDENKITVDGKLILDPSTRVLEFIFNVLKNTSKCDNFVKYMKVKGRLKKFYTEVGDENRVKIMAQILGTHEI